MLNFSQEEHFIVGCRILRNPQRFKERRHCKRTTDKKGTGLDIRVGRKAFACLCAILFRWNRAQGFLCNSKASAWQFQKLLLLPTPPPPTHTFHGRLLSLQWDENFLVQKEWLDSKERAQRWNWRVMCQIFKTPLPKPRDVYLQKGSAENCGHFPRHMLLPREASWWMHNKTLNIGTCEGKVARAP